MAEEVAKKKKKKKKSTAKVEKVDEASKIPVNKDSEEPPKKKKKKKKTENATTKASSKASSKTSASEEPKNKSEGESGSKSLKKSQSSSEDPPKKKKKKTTKKKKSTPKKSTQSVDTLETNDLTEVTTPTKQDVESSPERSSHDDAIQMQAGEDSSISNSDSNANSDQPPKPVLQQSASSESTEIEEEPRGRQTSRSSLSPDRKLHRSSSGDRSTALIPKREPIRGVSRAKSDGPIHRGVRRSSSGDRTTSFQHMAGSREAPSARGVQRFGSMPVSAGMRRGRKSGTGLDCISEHGRLNMHGRGRGRGGTTMMTNDDGYRAHSLSPREMAGGRRTISDRNFNGRGSSQLNSGNVGNFPGRGFPGRGRGRGRGPGRGPGGRGPGRRSASMIDLQAGIGTRPFPRSMSRGDFSGSVDGPPNARGAPSRSRSGGLEMMRRQQSVKSSAGRSRSAEFDAPLSVSSHHQNELQSSRHNLPHRTRPAARDPSSRMIMSSVSSHHTPGQRGLGPRDPSMRMPVRSTDSHSEYESDEDHSFEEEVSINFEETVTPKVRRKSSGSMDWSAHSFASTRSQLSSERIVYFEDDTPAQKVLRYLHILPPRPDESENKKWIRIYTWAALLLDFIAAMVSITTFKGVVTCCGVPIYSVAANINWNKTIRIMTYIYLALIFCEIIPVIRSGLPFNLINPLIGFTIFFAMFFDDRTFEAICMWIIESGAIVFEFMVYRIKSRIYHEKERRLQSYDKVIEKDKRRSKSSLVDSEDDSFAAEDFEDDLELSNSTIGFSKPYREMRLLRERRVLREAQSQNRIQLRYHFIGVVINFALVGISLTLVIVITRSGGLCMSNFEAPSVFKNDHKERCYLCDPKSSDVCEICDGPEVQCYYPYY